MVIAKHRLPANFWLQLLGKVQQALLRIQYALTTFVLDQMLSRSGIK